MGGGKASGEGAAEGVVLGQGNGLGPSVALVYSIRDWDDHFEIAQSRKVKERWTWVATPLKHDGKSFRRIMLMPDGMEIYGAWMLLVQMAAKCPTRGVLADADGPLTTEDMAIKTGGKPECFERALKVLSDIRIGWLLVAEWEGNGSTLPKSFTPNSTQPDPTNQPTHPQAEVLASPSDADAPPADHSGGRTGGRESGWGKVADTLTAMGGSRWREAIAEAKQCGCTPGHAMEIIAYAKSKNFRVGAVIVRLSKARPTLPLTEGWPEYETPAEKTNRVNRTAAEREQADEDEYRRKATSEQTDAEERERQYGPELDSMDPAEVKEICRSNPVMAKLQKKGEPSPMLRLWLLSQLEKRAMA